jgi:hypothetical protein
MAKHTNLGANINIEENILIPVKPATDNYRIPFVTEPSSFMMYGENALEQYNAEVRRVESEILREISGYTEEVELVREKKTNFCSISAIFFSILALAMLVVGKFLQVATIPGLFVIANGVDGITYILNFLESASFDINTLISVIGIAIVAVFCIISLIVGIFTIKRAGTGIFMKLCLFLSFSGSILVAMMLLVAGIDIEIGLYIVIGLTFLATLIGFISKGIVGKPIKE